MTAPDIHPARSLARRRRRRPMRTVIAWAAAWAALLTPVTTIPAADEPKPPATAPTTAPAASPKAVVVALGAAIDKGDAAAAAGLLLNDPAHAKWAASTVALAAALRKLDAAAIARFGDAGWSVSQGRLHLTEAFKAAEQGQEKVEGDAATLTVPGRDEPLHFKKGPGGRWLLSIAPEAPAAADRQRALDARLTAATTRTADEVAAGAYDSADAAAHAFNSRLADARSAD